MLAQHLNFQIPCSFVKKKKESLVNNKMQEKINLHINHKPQTRIQDRFSVIEWPNCCFCLPLLAALHVNIFHGGMIESVSSG